MITFILKLLGQIKTILEFVFLPVVIARKALRSTNQHSTISTEWLCE